VARRWSWVAPVVVTAALILSGCGSGSGVVQGHVLIFSPVPHVGSTTVPIARFTSTVEAKKGDRVVAHERVLRGNQFRFTLPAGEYELTATGAYNCRASVTVRAGRTMTADVRCVEP